MNGFSVTIFTVNIRNFFKKKLGAWFRVGSDSPVAGCGRIHTHTQPPKASQVCRQNSDITHKLLQPLGEGTRCGTACGSVAVRPRPRPHLGNLARPLAACMGAWPHPQHICTVWLHPKCANG